MNPNQIIENRFSVRLRGIEVAPGDAAARRGRSTRFTKHFRKGASRLLAAMAVAALGLTVCGVANAASAIPASSTGTQADCPWLNPQLPTAKRVSMLMNKMTVADEIEIVEGHGMHPYAGNTPAIPSLCVPAFTLQDGPNGVGDGLTGVTNLPSGASLAATFSPKLAYEYGQVVGAEQAAKGSDVDLGPTVNIDRDPRWGREFESFSEDPMLTTDIGVAEIHGIQSQRVMAQVKHFAAYNQETYRNTPEDDVIVSRRALHELYFPAFRAALRKGKSASIMCSYATVNGYYSCENHYLLTDVLRNEWNFNGFVTSDWGGIHSTSAAEAGSDMEQPESRYFGPALQKAVTDGTVNRAVLNSMVARIFYQMFRFHLFDHPLTGTQSTLATTPAHQALSTKIAETGTVLLKNDGDLLPLEASAKIAVIGPAASAQVTYGGGGSAHVTSSSTVSPLAGIQAVAGASGVSYTQGLPTNAQLRPIPAADLSTPYTGVKFNSSYTATLTPPETGTYIIGLTNGCHCYSVTTLSINGRTLINNPGTPPNETYSAAIHLNKGQAYTLTLKGPASMAGISKKELKKMLAEAKAKNSPMYKMMLKLMKSGPPSKLLWATPSTIDAEIQQAVNAAKSAKIAVVVVADDTESEGADRPDLRLPSAQNELVSAVAKANPHTIVVIQAGAPIAMPWLDQVPAILDTWYSGQTNGTALANVLFGKVDPSGHLPVTFPVKLADVPAANPADFPGVDGKVHYSEGLLVGYRWYDAKHITPMFPFGFGLSYTHFRYSDLHLSQNEVNGVTAIGVSARVTNTGHVAGADVAQLYLAMPASTNEPPRKLVAFHRVMLAPGESKEVQFIITPRDQWWWSNGGWTETAGTYHVYVGDSSALADLPLTAQYEMKTTVGDRKVTVSAPTTFQPGVKATVSVSLSTGGNETLNGVHLSLKAPVGWQVVPLGHGAHAEVTPGETVTETFAVTPPSGAVTQYVTLYGTADLAHDACIGGGVHRDGKNVRHQHNARWAGSARCDVRRDGGVTVLLES